MLSHRHLPLLATFVQVCREGSFTKAAQGLSLSKGQVSNHLRALEETLGARLLERTTRRVALTQIGQDVLDAADRDRPKQAPHPRQHQRRHSFARRGRRGARHVCMPSRQHPPARVTLFVEELRAVFKIAGFEAKYTGAAPRHALRYPAR